MTRIPILRDHDQRQPPIGMVEAVDGGLHVHFREDARMTLEQALDIFGGVGLRIIDATVERGAVLIRRAEILEWSLTPQPPACPTSKR